MANEHEEALRTDPVKLLEMRIGQILQTLIERGFEPPLVMVMVGVNGAVFVNQYSLADEETWELTVIFQPGEGVMLFPVSIMITDSKGDSAHAVTRQHGELDSVHVATRQHGEPTWASGLTGRGH